MKQEIKLLQKKFNEINAMGFVESHRSNNTGIGKTFEDLMGIVENNSKEPDFLSFDYYC